MHHNEIIRIFLDYFKKHKHKIIRESSLIPPEDDPSSLFTNSGMHPLKPYFLGLKTPPSKRLANVQKCVRTIDIDAVGDKRHLTFFYMLGNWSIGDYWKEEAIPLAWELLTKKLGFDPKKLMVSIFKGSKSAPKDTESEEIWIAIGVPKNKIVALGENDNWWASGPTGPCGPDTEIHYDRGPKYGCKNCKPGCNCERWLEVWNIVCMQYNQTSDGKLEDLPFKSIDTGAGLARIACLLQRKDSPYETTLFEPTLRQLEKSSGKKYSKNTKAMRIVLDHLRASCFIMNEGVEPEKIERGYVLRRLLRRLIIYGRKLGLKKDNYLELIKSINELYPEINLKKATAVFSQEFEKFNRTLDKGLNRLNKIIKGQKCLDCKEAFKMYDTYGFPFELIKELCSDAKVKVDEAGFNKCFDAHKEISKGKSKQRFKSGLSIEDDSTIRLHTATHLLNAALQKLIDKNIYQKGSNITPDRLRFDFPAKEKLSDEELQTVEDQVNTWIKQAIPVKREEMSVKAAKSIGAGGVFEHKYGNTVSVYTIGTISKEICAGPHVKNTSELGAFKIKKHESVGAGIKRIKAMLE